MARIAFGLEYDGGEFVGWQSQRTGRSVQSEVSRAVAAVANEPVAVIAAGRTDRGVHAAAQVAHFDTTASRTPRQWVLGINSNLPPDVAVHWAQPIARDFDARRSALYRRYRYLLLERETRPALARGRAWWLRTPVDCARITRAAAAWLGENDFSAFRAAGCQSHTPMRRLMRVTVRREDALVAIEFTANAFLQHMVRNFVGALVDIGHGRMEPSWAAELLAGRDRRRGAAAAPPHGLTLVEVGYPAVWALPAAAEQLPRL